MQSYVKPIFRMIEEQAEECGCCEYYTYSGETVYFYPGSSPSGTAPPPGTVASGSSGNASATPLCGTQTGVAPVNTLTQANTFGVPVGASGYQFYAGDRGVSAGGDGQTLGVGVLGQNVLATDQRIDASVYVSPRPVCNALVCTG